MQEDNVYELAAWRARLRPAGLPPEVAVEMDLASRLYDALEAQGFELRFELPEDGGPVTCELRSHDGEQSRRVSLFEAVGAEEPPDDEPPPPPLVA
jgi:hypothetical protein